MQGIGELSILADAETHKTPFEREAHKRKQFLRGIPVHQRKLVSFCIPGVVPAALPMTR